MRISQRGFRPMMEHYPNILTNTRPSFFLEINGKTVSEHETKEEASERLREIVQKDGLLGTMQVISAIGPAIKKRRALMNGEEE